MFADRLISVFQVLLELSLSPQTTLNWQSAFAHHTAFVMKHMIIPNLVWRAGKRAVVVRQLAMTWLLALMNSQMLSQEAVSPLLSQDLLPHIVSNLDEDDVASRRATLQVLNQLLALPSWQGMSFLDSSDCCLPGVF